MSAARAAILASSSSPWHVQDLLRAGRQLGIEVERLGFEALGASVACAHPLRWPPAELDVDLVLVRSMPAGSLDQVIFRMDVLGRLEARGARVINPPRALETAIDKYLSLARLEEAGLPVPPTVVVQRAADALAAFDALGGDVVVKPLFGSEGRGLHRIRDRTEAAALLDTLEAGGQALYLQAFIDHPGHDLRVFVIGGRVLAGMRRIATEGWATNIALGGRAEALAVSAELGALALRAAAATGAEVAGVDVVPDRDGKLHVLEVNAVPGWRALAAATGVDVAREVWRHALRPGA